MLRQMLVGSLIALAFSGVPAAAAGGTSDAYAAPQDSTRPPWHYRLADVRLELDSYSPVGGISSPSGVTGRASAGGRGQMRNHTVSS